MKKTMVSLAAVAALTTGAFAADKGIDIVTTGQAVVYYQTNDTDAAGDEGFFNNNNSNANVGIQLNLNADLKNNFTFGAQLSYVDALGLNNNLVADTNIVQNGGSLPRTDALGGNSTADDLALTKIFVAKKVGNTTVKIGRQELPKSLSPLAYSEGWNVFKNTFEAIVAINTDLPKTTIVGAYVGGSNSSTDLSMMTDLTTNAGAVADGAYMLTAQTTLIPMTTLTASYYTLHDVASAGISADALWIDAKITDKSLPMGLALGAQYGNIDPDGIDDTTAYGVKASIKPMDALTLCAAYTDVDDKGVVTVKNVGTGVKSPLYTQMILNQNHIAAIDNSTWMLKANYGMGDMGSLTAQYSDTSDDSAADSDYSELDVIYKVKAAGVNYFASYSMTEHGSADRDMIRVWGRYNF